MRDLHEIMAAERCLTGTFILLNVARTRVQVFNSLPTAAGRNRVRPCVGAVEDTHSVARTVVTRMLALLDKPSCLLAQSC